MNQTSAPSCHHTGNMVSGDVQSVQAASKLKTRAIFLGLGLTGLFILLVSMLEPLHFSGWKLVIFALSTFVVFGAGRRFHLGAYRSVKALSPNMNTLVSLGTISAWIWSVTALWRDTDLYFETAAVVVLIILFGNWLEQSTARASNQAIAKLRKMVPKTVLLENGDLIENKDLKVGMNFRAREGEFITADGIVTEGIAALDTSMITGEPLTREVSVGDEVIGSTVVKKGSLIVTATRTGETTLHSHILRLVEQAQMASLPVQKLVDKVSGIFTYAVLLIAVTATSIWFLSGSAIANGIEAGISVLLIACPCALGLATPIAIMAGTSRGAEMGIVLKNTSVLETTKNIDVAALDKTGTLTSGEIRISQVLTDFDGSRTSFSQDELLDMAVALESHSTHPIGVAITNAHRDLGHGNIENCDLPEVYDFETHTGLGVSAMLKTTPKGFDTTSGVADSGATTSKTMLKSRQVENGQKVALGKAELFKEIPEHLVKAQKLAAENGDMTAFCGTDDTAQGLIVLTDSLRPEAETFITRLKKLGIKPVMITGDSKSAAQLLANKLGIEEVHADVLPHQKADLIKQLQNTPPTKDSTRPSLIQKIGKLTNRKSDEDETSSRVLMVGDGINDAIALATADLSIAIGSGTEAALESSDMALIGKDLRGAVDALVLARKTRSTIVSNLFWAFFYNAAAIPLAAAGFLSPIIATAAMSFSSLFVILNSARLRRFKGSTTKPLI